MGMVTVCEGAYFLEVRDLPVYGNRVAIQLVFLVWLPSCDRKCYGFLRSSVSLKPDNQRFLSDYSLNSLNIYGAAIIDPLIFK